MPTAAAMKPPNITSTIAPATQPPPPPAPVLVEDEELPDENELELELEEPPPLDEPPPFEPVDPPASARAEEGAARASVSASRAIQERRTRATVGRVRLARNPLRHCPSRQRGRQRVSGGRTADVEALGSGAAQVAEALEARAALDALPHDLKAEAARQFAGGADDRRVDLVVGNVVHEDAVDLQL